MTNKEYFKLLKSCRYRDCWMMDVDCFGRNWKNTNYDFNYDLQTFEYSVTKQTKLFLIGDNNIYTKNCMQTKILNIFRKHWP